MASWLPGAKITATPDPVMADHVRDTTSATSEAIQALISAVAAVLIAADPTLGAAAAAQISVEIIKKNLISRGDKALPTVFDDPTKLAVFDDADGRAYMDVDTADGGVNIYGPLRLGVQLQRGTVPDYEIARTEVDAGGVERVVWGPKLDGTWTIHPDAHSLAFIASAISTGGAPPEVVLPSRVYGLVGRKLTLRPDPMIDRLSADHRVKVDAGQLAGTQDTGVVLGTDQSAGTTGAMTVSVQNVAGATVASTTTQVTFVAPPAGPVRVLGVGDSKRRDGWLMRYIADLLGGTSVGTRYFESSLGASEAHSGWTLADHLTRWGSTDGDMDSLLVSPEGITPTSWRGNVADWKQAVTLTETSSQWGGYQRLAKGWSGSSYLYDAATGYPLTPANGDVVYDRAAGTGAARFRTWDGTAWNGMATAPTMSPSLTRYFARWGSTVFAGGLPTVINVCFGPNDFNTGYDATTSAAFVARVNEFIALVRAWSSTVPIVIDFPTTAGRPGLWYRRAETWWEYTTKMRKVAKLLITTYDTPAARANHVHLSAAGFTVDPALFVDAIHENKPSTGGAAAGTDYQGNGASQSAVATASAIAAIHP